MITSAFEHHAILNSCAAIERLGYSVEYLKPDSSGYRISHVLEAIGLDEKLARGTIRIAFGRFNDPSDAKKLAEALIKVVKNTR